MTVSEKKSTDHLGFEPGTFSLLIWCSNNGAYGSDGEEQRLHYLKDHVSEMNFFEDFFQIYSEINIYIYIY